MRMIWNTEVSVPDVAVNLFFRLERGVSFQVCLTVRRQTVYSYAK